MSETKDKDCSSEASACSAADGSQLPKIGGRSADDLRLIGEQFAQIGRAATKCGRNIRAEWLRARRKRLAASDKEI